MGHTRTSFAVVSALLFLGSATASAQPLSGPLNYDVKTLTFELWCQETQRYPTERCNARRPADVAAFEAYRASIERYELQYLKQVDRERQIRRHHGQMQSGAVFCMDQHAMTSQLAESRVHRQRYRIDHAL